MTSFTHAQVRSVNNGMYPPEYVETVYVHGMSFHLHIHTKSKRSQVDCHNPRAIKSCVTVMVRGGVMPAFGDN